jgi:hypothetical protein
MSTRFAATIIVFAALAFTVFAAPYVPTPTEPHTNARVWAELVLQHQSGEIDFSDWITLFTLCLAPIAAHIIAGVPTPGMYSYIVKHK